MRFDDYHRTVIGYHGTRLSVARGIVTRRRGFEPSRNRDDWLGQGVYFWEYAPYQAEEWARRRKKLLKWKEPVAVLGSMIRLGYCLDLLDPHNVRIVKSMAQNYREAELIAGRGLPENMNHHKYLDCAVFEYVYEAIRDARSGSPVDTARAVYVPTDSGKRIWKRSWISEGAHIQICVRNSASILGTWLHSHTD